jgi:hypothetical protein
MHKDKLHRTGYFQFAKSLRGAQHNGNSLPIFESKLPLHTPLALELLQLWVARDQPVHQLHLSDC